MMFILNISQKFNDGMTNKTLKLNFHLTTSFLAIHLKNMLIAYCQSY